MGFGRAFAERSAREADPPSAPTGGLRWPALRGARRVHMRGPRQCLRVYVLPDVRQPAVPDGNGEDEMVLESLVRGFDFPLSEADDQDPVSLRYELPGFRGR